MQNTLATWLSISLVRPEQDEIDKTVTMLYRPDGLCALTPLSCLHLFALSSSCEGSSRWRSPNGYPKMRDTLSGKSPGGPGFGMRLRLPSEPMLTQQL